MASIGDVYQAAVQAHQAGRLADAERLYRQVLAAEPQHAYALDMLGLLALQAGHADVARELIGRAIALAGNVPLFHVHFGSALHVVGRRGEARTSFERALALDANTVEALLALAHLERQEGHTDRARACLQQATAVQPAAAGGHYQLGNLEAAAGNWSLAEQCFRAALAIDSRSAPAEARLGVTLQAQQKLDEAVEHYRKALALDPNSAEAHYNLGTALAEMGQAQEAVTHYEAAIRIQPNHASAHTNLGAFYQEALDYERALAHYEAVLRVEPHAAEAHYNRALMLLTRGELAAGWQEYEWRLRLPGFPIHVMREPLWDGSPLIDKTLLVHAEQGLGDTLHFIRYIPLVKKLCPRLLVQVPPALVPLLTHSGFGDLLVTDDALPAFDVQVPMLSLPWLLGTTPENIPAPIPYLGVPDDMVTNWRRRLSDVEGFRVGIAWQGSPANKGDWRRSMPLSEFAPLASVRGVTLVSLQKRDGERQLRDAGFPLYELQGVWDEMAGPFVDTAAVIQNLDLVITADTATAHLAGALGARVWVPLGTKADWRWFLDRSDTPWYPTMRFYRQTQIGEWGDVFARMADDLAACAEKSA
ncbi:MAG: tetratricopeptide repeat protein [Planctomycetota bacterium]|nr:MAG: tetratricopeptide repeat protein [Planctomycetota bacterium]